MARNALKHNMPERTYLCWACGSDCDSEVNDEGWPLKSTYVGDYPDQCLWLFYFVPTRTTQYSNHSNGPNELILARVESRQSLN